MISHWKREPTWLYKQLFGKGPRIKPVFKVSSLSVKKKRLVDFIWEEEVLFALMSGQVFGHDQTTINLLCDFFSLWSRLSLCLFCKCVCIELIMFILLYIHHYLLIIFKRESYFIKPDSPLSKVATWDSHLVSSRCLCFKDSNVWEWTADSSKFELENRKKREQKAFTTI